MQAGNEQLPNTGRTATAHWMTQAMPTVKVTYNADTLDIGCPHSEQATFDTVNHTESGTKDAIDM